ncbi:transposase [Rubeoparvulum massiliense]|uniref:transposase n=1 Tax=Rubeoparvulum massiliense TaxID=1631346 RepID=UPI0021C40242|nr:transposase [Rubeoparvulum massiliense]
MIEAIPDEQLFVHYTGGGHRAYHPKMMLKVILYGYSQKVYSCRGIEKLLQENIPAMWLAAMQQPDFRTLNDFRGQRMKAFMDELFETMIRKLIADNYITMEHYFLDGTKIEANPNKYSFVWKKSTLRFEEKLKERIQATLPTPLPHTHPTKVYSQHTDYLRTIDYKFHHALQRFVSHFLFRFPRFVDAFAYEAPPY